MNKDCSPLSQIETPKSDEIIVIAGPTASGKTDLSIQVALKFNGEVISADSRQIYRGLDIGSAKITKQEMRGVPHHLIDILSPGEKYSVAQFQADTLSLIKDIQERGKIPIICGGTGLYIESVVEGYQFGDSGGKSKLKNGYNPKFRVYLLHWPRDILRERISLRVDQRMKQEMLKEVQNLIDAGLDPQWLISLGLEYKCLTEYLLGSGSLTDKQKDAKLDAELQECITKLKFKSYQFSKRQDTWFRRWSYAKEISII
jgi:tRNA dimethylallyltransferase